MFLAGDAPLPAEYAFLALGDLRRELPGRHGERVLLAVDCANARGSAPTGARSTAPLVVDVDHHHDNTRFGDDNLVVADASSTAEIVRDLLCELGVAADAGDRRGALRRPRHRHRPLPVLEHDAEGAAARGRAGRGGGRRARDLPARLRDGAVREAEAARARARPRPALRGRAARRVVSPARRLRGGRRRGAVLRGDHRLPPRRSRARRWSR